MEATRHTKTVSTENTCILADLILTGEGPFGVASGRELAVCWLNL